MQLFGETVIDWTSPQLISKADYLYSRSGSVQYYTLYVHMRTGSTTAHWDDTWVIRIWCNGGEVIHNGLIKGRTYGTIGTNWYSGTFSFNTNIGNVPSGQVVVSINYYTAGYSGSIDAQGQYRGVFNGWMQVNPLSVVYLGFQSKTNNSITLTYSSSNVNAEYIHVYNGNYFLGQYNTSPFTIAGLLPYTPYGDLKAFGYANGTFGVNGNSLAITTYPNPVNVGSVVVNNVTPFGCNVDVKTDNDTFVDKIEYSLFNNEGSIVQQPVETTSFSYTFSNLTENTTYKVKVRVKTKESGVWSEYKEVSFTTLTDQASLYININNQMRKGKLYIKKGNQWVKSKKVYIKKNGNWVLGKNK